MTLSGSNLAGVTEVDFGNGNAGAIEVGHVVVGDGAARRRRPRGVGPTTEVIVKTGHDALGFDGEHALHLHRAAGLLDRRL